MGNEQATVAVREVPIGSRVIHTHQEGVFRYDGRASSSALHEIAVSFGRELSGLKCDPDQVAPEGTPVPERDPRVSAVKRARGEYPTWLGSWQGFAAGVSVGFHRTKRDAVARGLRTVAIADWHAANPT